MKARKFAEIPSLCLIHRSDSKLALTDGLSRGWGQGDGLHEVSGCRSLLH